MANSKIRPSQEGKEEDAVASTHPGPEPTEKDVESVQMQKKEAKLESDAPNKKVGAFDDLELPEPLRTILNSIAYALEEDAKEYKLEALRKAEGEIEDEEDMVPDGSESQRSDQEDRDSESFPEDREQLRRERFGRLEILERQERLARLRRLRKPQKQSMETEDELDFDTGEQLDDLDQPDTQGKAEKAQDFNSSGGFDQPEGLDGFEGFLRLSEGQGTEESENEESGRKSRRAALKELEELEALKKLEGLKELGGLEELDDLEGLLALIKGEDIEAQRERNESSSPDDELDVREILEQFGGFDPEELEKIENPSSLEEQQELLLQFLLR